ncbi:MAG: translational machinery protein [Betaproteobacteria bacterium]|nr:translational machinery protein [Betaproteobacteria bacterium]
MAHYHVVVWLDHSEAHVMHVNPEDVETSIVHPAEGRPRLHIKRGIIGDGRLAEDQHYYRDIAQAIGDAHEILVVGPSTAKLVFIKYLAQHDPQKMEHVIGVETVDHPTDAQLVAHARSYFRARDRMLP